MRQQDFEKDLKIGKWAETQVLNYLQQIKYDENYEIAPDEKFSDWDFIHFNIKYEIKYDYYPSSNLCVEYKYKDNTPSGVYLSMSDIFVNVRDCKFNNATETYLQCTFFNRLKFIEEIENKYKYEDYCRRLTPHSGHRPNFCYLFSAIEIFNTSHAILKTIYIQKKEN